MNFSIVRSILAAGVLTAATAAISFAQTSGNVTGCLNPGGSLTKIAIGDLPRNDCSTVEKQVTLSGANPFGTNGAFYIALSRETERVIAAKGNLKITARCTALDPEAPDQITLKLKATGTAHGWYATSDHLVGSSFGPQPGGSSLDVEIASKPTDQSYVQISNLGATVWDRDSFLGLHRLQFQFNYAGRDCLVIGIVSSAQRVP